MPTAVPCSGECVGTYKKCAGKGIEAQVPCCDATDQCVLKNSYYSQCRPKSKGIPSHWTNGVVLEECTSTHAGAAHLQCMLSTSTHCHYSSY